jgi:predicted amidohydrolase
MSTGEMSMRYAVAVPEITSNIGDNLEKILSMMHAASISGANILLFPEAVLTGLNICDDYHIDRQYACSLDSFPVRTIIDNAGKSKMWTAFGFLELSHNTIFDSVILVDDNGKIVLHQRRMSPGWKARNANPIEYGCGTSLSTCITPWGKTAILICGDLFETAFPYAVVAKLDLLLFTLARCFSPKVKEPQRQWDNIEWPRYSAQIKEIGALTLMSNYIASPELNRGGFGGGFIVDRNGIIIKAKPLFEEGLVICDEA